MKTKLLPFEEPKKSKYAYWKRIDYKPVGHDYICSNCKNKSAGNFPFCPYCGKKMILK